MVTPLVSVVILYYKRRDIIEETLRSAVTQEYSNREIILIDNNSEDDVASVVKEIGPGINLISVAENVGACAGRNIGIRAARGEILVFLDDDVPFASTAELGKIVAKFGERQDIHVLALQICDYKTTTARVREWCHTRPYDEYVNEEFETNWYGEGASAFRREVFDVCGLYYEPLYYGAEGHDMVLRMLDRCFRILHTPEIRVFHCASESGRSYDRQNYYYTRNFIWMTFKDYDLWHGICFAIPKMLMMSYFAIRTRTYAAVLKGIRDGLAGFSMVRRDRTPVSASAVRLMAEHEKWRPGIVTRFARHRVTPQI